MVVLCKNTGPDILCFSLEKGILTGLIDELFPDLQTAQKLLQTNFLLWEEKKKETFEEQHTG